MTNTKRKLWKVRRCADSSPQGPYVEMELIRRIRLGEFEEKAEICVHEEESWKSILSVQTFYDAFLENVQKGILQSHEDFEDGWNQNQTLSQRNKEHLEDQDGSKLGSKSKKAKKDQTSYGDKVESNKEDEKRKSKENFSFAKTYPLEASKLDTQKELKDKSDKLQNQDLEKDEDKTQVLVREPEEEKTVVIQSASKRSKRKRRRRRKRRLPPSKPPNSFFPKVFLAAVVAAVALGAWSFFENKKQLLKRKDPFVKLETVSWGSKKIRVLILSKLKEIYL